MLADDGMWRRHPFLVWRSDYVRWGGGNRSERPTRVAFAPIVQRNILAWTSNTDAVAEADFMLRIRHETSRVGDV